MKKYEWIDHPSDTGFLAHGSNLEEAFENAAIALYDIMIDVDKVESKGEISINLEAEDKKALLYDWLDFLLYLFTGENMVMSEFEVEDISEQKGSYQLRAKARGEKYDVERHGADTEVKAITYHLMEVNCHPESCSIQVVVDI